MGNSLKSRELFIAVSLTRDMVIAFAAIMTATAAIWGINTWRRELRGKTEYDLVIRFLKSVYALEDHIEFARDPLVEGYELAERRKSENVGNESREEGQIRDEAYAYTVRLKPVAEEFRNIRTIRFEILALLGKENGDLAKEVLEKASKLFRAHQTYYELRLFSDLNDPGVKELIGENRETLFFLSKNRLEDRDIYMNELKDIIFRIEQKFQKYLR